MFLEKLRNKLRHYLRAERVKGIEPSSSAWKAVALPLSYTRTPHPGFHCLCFTLIKWGVQDSNLRRRCQRIYSPSPLTARETPQDHPVCSDADSALNPLSKHCFFQVQRSQRRDSNPRPADYKSAALPTELRWLGRYVTPAGKTGKYSEAPPACNSQTEIVCPDSLQSSEMATALEQTMPPIVAAKPPW